MGDWAWSKVKARILHQNGNNSISSGKTEWLNEWFQFGFSAFSFIAPNTLYTKEALEYQNFLEYLAFLEYQSFLLLFKSLQWLSPDKSWVTSISLCWPREVYGTNQDTTSISRKRCPSACSTLLIKFSWSKSRNLFSGLGSWLHFGQYWQAQPCLPQKLPCSWSLFSVNMLSRQLGPYGFSLFSQPQASLGICLMSSLILEVLLIWGWTF